MTRLPRLPRVALLVLSTLAGCAVFSAAHGASAQPSAPPPFPPPSWTTDLAKYLQPTQALPTDEPLSDGAFHQWSWEAFVWATAIENGMPRFMSLSTPASLLSSTPPSTPGAPPQLKLALRSHATSGTPGYVEGAGAIVEADGNMLVSQQGYPVYASVHLNPSYFATAQQNLLITGAYDANTGKDDYFDVGAAVFKATWLPLNPATTPPAASAGASPSQWAPGTYTVTPPAGAYITQAQVPVLTTSIIEGFTIIHPVIPQQLITINVALVGLHVVGYATNHPEFLWGTFEHKANAPMLPDNSFPTDPTIQKATSNPNSFTFYQAGTTYDQVNLANQNPGTTPVLDATTQTLSPVTNVVLLNVTGGETTQGAANITALNTAGQAFLAGQTNPTQALFANYMLIGTVWLAPNSYSTSSTAADAIGSLNLANSTAETFQQIATNTVVKNNQNCFTCHNATSYSFQPIPHAVRRIALSHVLSQGLPVYGVPNQIPAVPLIPHLK